MKKVPFKKIIVIMVRVILALAVIAGIFIGVLKMAERSNDPLRLGLQDYLTKMTGNPAEIETLDNIQLFPKMHFNIKGILIRDKSDRDKALVRADSAYISMNFWKSFFGIRNYDAIEIKNLELATGFVLPKKVSLAFVGISDPDDTTSPPYFMFDGTYNDRPLLITAQMTRYGTPKNFSYDFAREFPVTFKLGNTEANAIFKRSLTQVDFAQITLVNGKQEALLSAPGMIFNPLHIPLKGKIAGFPMTGDITHLDDKYTVTIIPETADKKSLMEINGFISAIEKDFGIDKTSKNITIVVTPAETGVPTPADDKEKSR